MLQKKYFLLNSYKTLSRSSTKDRTVSQHIASPATSVSPDTIRYHIYTVPPDTIL